MTELETTLKLIQERLNALQVSGPVVLLMAEIMQLLAYAQSLAKPEKEEGENG